MLKELDCEVIITKSNADLGGGSINKYIFFFSYILTTYIMYLVYNKKMEKGFFIKNVV